MAKKARILAVLLLVALASPGVARSADPPYDHWTYVPLVQRAPESQCGVARVFDYDGNERGWDWLVEEFGAVWIGSGNGSACVTELRAKEHTYAALVIRVRNPQGEPVGGVPVVNHWPDADPLPRELVGCYDNGDHTLTKYPPDDGAGNAEFGIGGGSYYFPPEGGPHTVWVGVAGSDCVYGLGMLGGTEHNHLEPTYLLTGK
jgi:hypothetical protein